MLFFEFGRSDQSRDRKGAAPTSANPQHRSAERSAQRTLRRADKVRALTMVELLVVIVIIVVLFSSVFVASSHLLGRARSSSTRALLQVVNDAVEQFAREQKSNPTIVKATRDVPGPPPEPYGYAKRYGEYPPDELEVFTPNGVPGWPPPTGSASWSLAPNKATIVPTPSPSAKWPHMHFDAHGDVSKDPLEHRDLAAMIVAIETLGNESKVLLDRVPDRNRTAGPVDKKDGTMLVYLDRPSGGKESKAGAPDAGDLQIRYIVDDWGIPLSYFATRDWVPSASAATTDPKASSNHPRWREASTRFVQLNKGLPIIMSYGPDGKEQQSEEWMHLKPDGSTGDGLAEASLVGDYVNNTDGKIDHPLNQDNLYLDPDLKERLTKGPIVAP